MIAPGSISGFSEVGIRNNRETRIDRFLDTNGDGSGAKNVIGNYAGGSAETFFIAPPSDKKFVLSRMMVSIRDTGSMDSGLYGNGITITNGLTLKKKDGSGDILDMLDGLTIKTNGDWGRHCYDVSRSNFGSGDEYITVRWSFFRAGNKGINLSGAAGEFFELGLNDDFSGLVEHYYFIEGYEEAE